MDQAPLRFMQFYSTSYSILGNMLSFNLARSSQKYLIILYYPSEMSDGKLNAAEAQNSPKTATPGLPATVTELLVIALAKFRHTISNHSL